MGRRLIILPMRNSKRRCRGITHGQHDIGSPVHQSHALARNPKRFDLVGEETTVGRNLREGRRCERGSAAGTADLRMEFGSIWFSLPCSPDSRMVPTSGECGRWAKAPGRLPPPCHWPSSARTEPPPGPGFPGASRPCPQTNSRVGL